MTWLRNLKPDTFLLAIVSSAVLASIFPATGVFVGVLDWATKVAIFALFFLYGARLKPTEALKGLIHWRLHLTILLFTFVMFPLLGLALKPLAGHLFATELYPGLLWLTLVPSTIQSSIAFTSIARGNVAGAIVSASASNMLGVVVTPMLALWLMSTTGSATIDPGSILDIGSQILLPFVLGQVSRRWTATWVTTHAVPLKLVDRGSIVLVVYSAFSAGRRENMWATTSVASLAQLVAVCLCLLAFALTATYLVAKLLGFNREDRIAIQFCGTKKSLATGLPMAQVLFAGSPIGLMVLPLIVFHQAQLMACSALAGRYARDPLPEPDKP